MATNVSRCKCVCALCLNTANIRAIALATTTRSSQLKLERFVNWNSNRPSSIVCHWIYLFVLLLVFIVAVHIHFFSLAMEIYSQFMRTVWFVIFRYRACIFTDKTPSNERSCSSNFTLFVSDSDGQIIVRFSHVYKLCSRMQRLRTWYSRLLSATKYWLDKKKTISNCVWFTTTFELFSSVFFFHTKYFVSLTLLVAALKWVIITTRPALLSFLFIFSFFVFDK